MARYRAKRDFARTPEPSGDALAEDGHLFVVQKHAARQLHYDFRLQFGDALKSWAVKKGPSLDPKQRRLAVLVEDHPIDYGSFEGLIPRGEYGGGTVLVWDRGTWVPMDDPEASFRKGLIKFRLNGEKLGGGWSLVRMKGAEDNAWLLVKERDIYAESDEDVLEAQPLSVLSGRSIEDIRREAEPEPKKNRRAVAPRPAKIKGARRAALGDAPRPQLASLVDAPPSGPGWLHEIKYDGYRTLCRLDNGDARLFTRNGHDWTERYRAIADALARLPCKQAIIDGEIAVQDGRGVTTLSALQEALSADAQGSLVYFVFDLLYLDGYDLTGALLLERKAALDALLARADVGGLGIEYSDHVVGHGADFLAQAATHGLEGIVSKKVDAPYESGRTTTWQKTKCIASDDFVIVGYTESQAAGGLASLLVAEPGESELRYVGRVGTGFGAAQAKTLRPALKKARRKTPALTLPKGAQTKDVIWTSPSLVAEVQYVTRTANGMLRGAAYKGLRPDKPVKLANGATAAERKRYVSEADLATIWITNPDREMFGKGGPTKLDLALYYARVGDWILPHLIRRPVTLVRCPTGEVEDCFYQRHLTAGMPAHIHRIGLREEGTKERPDYLYVEDAKGLLGLAQFGVIELHPWGCRTDRPERPDRMIIDLDPHEGLDWREVVDAAMALREALTRLGLVAFVKTTGGKGLHVVVPVERRLTWAGLKDFSHRFVQGMAGRSPERFTANPSRASRRGKIYLDYLRNGRGATAVAAYSLRARPGAPVATPLDWRELEAVEDPREFNYFSVPDRLAELSVDPWADMESSTKSITKEMVLKIGR